MLIFRLEEWTSENKREIDNTHFIITKKREKKKRNISKWVCAYLQDILMNVEMEERL